MEKYEFENRLKTAAEDPELKGHMDESRLRYHVVKTLIGARLAANMTEKELAKRTGIRPGRIDKIENQLTSPTLEELQKIAAATGRKLNIEVL